MFNATSIYGAPPIRGEGPASMNGRMAGAGAVSTPVEAQPAATAINALNDPTLWLVLMFGAAAYLAIWAEPGS